MTRPTIDDLRVRVGLPIAPAPRNTTEPCRICADAGAALEYDGEVRAVVCLIPKERLRLYPGIRGVVVPSDAVRPCWRGAPHHPVEVG